MDDKQVKTIDLEAGRFEANGKVYLIEKSLSIDRWIKMNELEVELGFGVSYREMQASWSKVYELCNDRGGRFADVAVTAYNMSNGISKVFDRQPQVLKFCALFFNTEDEDRRTITDEQIGRKVEDWKAEGLSIDSFFVFSLGLVQGLADGYKQAIRSVSELALPIDNQPETAV